MQQIQMPNIKLKFTRYLGIQRRMQNARLKRHKTIVQLKMPNLIQISERKHLILEIYLEVPRHFSHLHAQISPTRTLYLHSPQENFSRLYLLFPLFLTYSAQELSYVLQDTTFFPYQHKSKPPKDLPYEHTHTHTQKGIQLPKIALKFTRQIGKEKRLQHSKTLKIQKKINTCLIETMNARHTSQNNQMERWEVKTIWREGNKL